MHPEHLNGWRARAACLGVASAPFFIERGKSQRSARALCRDCPVIDACTDFAVGVTVDGGPFKSPEKFGMWGGLSSRELRRLRDRVLTSWNADNPTPRFNTSRS